MTFCRSDPDAARDAVLLDGIGDVARFERLRPTAAPRDLMSDPAWLRGRIVRLARRLEEDGVALAAVLVEPESVERLRAEMFRLEQAIAVAMGFAPLPAEPVVGLDEPGVGEALAAE